MNSTISIRPYNDGDLDGVLDLLRVSLGETETNRRSPELFAWKHLDNPFGRSLMLVAEDAGGLVGFRAFMRWDLSTPDGQTVRCVRPVDTATHPRAQRQGIFRNLTTEAVALALNDGIDLIFNTPNPRSGAGYLSMGWSEVGKIGVMFRPKSRMLLGKRTGFPSVDGSSSWSGQSIEDRPPIGLRTARTAEYLTWRFGHPFAGYRVVAEAGGMAILRPNNRKGRYELVVSDLLGFEPTKSLAKAARNTNADYLIGWFGPGTPERRAALRATLIPFPGVTALTMVARPLRPGLEWATKSLGAWDLSLSDLELL